MWDDVKFKHQTTKKTAGKGIKFLIFLFITTAIGLVVFIEVGKNLPLAFGNILEMVGMPRLGMGINRDFDVVLGFVFSWIIGAIPSFIFCLATFREARGED